jgi:hypothetical protein
MSGSYCPQCFQLTFFQTRVGRRCSKCGHFEVEPAKAYRGEQGVPFSVESLKYIGAKETKRTTTKPASAQAELNRLIKSAGKKR